MLKDKKKEMILNTINLALLTSPFLLAVMTLEAIFDLGQEMGEVSEEVFRGTRLPILNVELKQQQEKT